MYEVASHPDLPITPLSLAGGSTAHQPILRPPKDEPSLPERSAKRILLVEDDHAIRDSMRLLLVDSGYDVDACENGERALDLLGRGPVPDLIVLDLRMPVMDGWEFRTRQRDNPVLASIPVVAISADGSAQAQAIHADAYLQKPLGADVLVGTVDRVLRQREARQMAERLVEAERLAALGRLAAGVGHEINNPLTYVTINIQEIMQLLDGAPEAKLERLLDLPALRDMMNDVQDGLEHVCRIVAMLQSLSRKGDNALETVDLEALLDRALAIVDHQLRPRARVVRTYAGLPPVMANAGMLMQVFINLLVNAAQAIDEGNADGHKVMVCTRTEGDWIVIEISDTGAGIPPEVLPSVFDAFFTTKVSAKGTGIGLAICKQIIDEHGGEIDLRNREGGGTSVRVRLPRTPARRPRPKSDHDAPTGGPVRKRRLLVIDDEPSIGRAIVRSLGAEHEVVVAETSAEALSLIEGGERFDLLLCDVIMPMGGGLAMREGLKAQAPEQLPRLVFMTGGAFTPQAETLVHESDGRVLMKPFTVDEIRLLLQSQPPLSASDAREQS